MASSRSFVRRAGTVLVAFGAALAFAAIPACHDDAAATWTNPVGPAPTDAPPRDATTTDATSADAADATSLDAADAAAEEDLDAGPPGPTFRYVYSIFRAHCSSGCHVTTSFPSGGLGMATRALAYQNLVGADTAGNACRGRKRVVANDPEASLLYKKIARDAPCGDPMPPEEGKELSSDQVGFVRAWILAGAPND